MAHSLRGGAGSGFHKKKEPEVVEDLLFDCYAPPNYFEGGALFLVRCPRCGKSNHEHLIPVGRCGFCGWSDDLDLSPE